MLLTRRALLQLGLAAAGSGLGLRLARGATAPAIADDRVARLLAYHELSKHRPDRSAPAPGRVVWEEQPDSFRRFVGAPLLALDVVPRSARPTWDQVVSGALPPAEPDRAAISQLLGDSLAISAWKENGRTRWALRVNPSSGNLHPVEAYLVGGPFPGLTAAPALLHHAPGEHALERRAAVPEETWRAIAAGLPPRAFLVALTVIPWREAWKYGERGWRYTLLDVGHAIGAVAVAAAALGWRARLVEGWTDVEVARLTGVDRQTGPEAEQAAALLAVWPGGPWPLEVERTARLPAAAAAALRELPLVGTSAPLGGDHVEWPASEDAAEAAGRDAPPAPGFLVEPSPSPLHAPERWLAGRALIRQRRSALGFDAAVAATRDAFFRVLGRTLPAATPAIFDALPWRPAIQLAVMVHRVEGISPGVYLLPRDPASRRALEAEVRARGVALALEEAPFPLLRIEARDVRAAARAAGCDQDVAADGAFTVAMLAPVEETLRAHGGWAYRTLHHEAGAVGQALYLEAEAVGLRGTAMGCFLDDEVRRVIGLRTGRFQPLHTLAVGRAIEDARLRPSP